VPELNRGALVRFRGCNFQCSIQAESASIESHFNRIPHTNSTASINCFCFAVLGRGRGQHYSPSEVPLAHWQERVRSYCQSYGALPVTSQSLASYFFCALFACATFLLGQLVSRKNLLGFCEAVQSISLPLMKVYRTCPEQNLWGAISFIFSSPESLQGGNLWTTQGKKR
jgi:hypothetical protein